jgi:hypothetical protein
MNTELYNFKYWMNYKVEKLSNREVIYDFSNKLLELIDSLHLKKLNTTLANEFIAFLYEHSKKSKIVKNIYKTKELPNELFFFKYESIFLEFFDEMKEFFKQHDFNILDSNLNCQKSNFIDLIENNIHFPHIEDDFEEIEEDFSDFEY